MSTSLEIQADEILSSYSPGKLAYETKQATKKGFKTVKDHVLEKLSGGTNKEEPAEIVLTAPKAPPILNLSWKKEVKGKLIFDWNSVLKDLKKSKNKTSDHRIRNLVPTREMFERFLLDIGSKSPSDYRVIQGNVDLSAGTTDFLDSIIRFFMGDIFVDQDHPNYNNSDVFVWFRDLQNLIENNEMYWLLFTKFYVRDERSLNPEDLENPKRSTVSLPNRIRASLKLNTEKDSKIWNIHKHLDYLGAHEDNDEIDIFRSFSVQTKSYDENGKLVRGKSVRKGITRLSEEGGIHMEGSGYSYSISKAVAMRMGYPINIPIIKKHCRVDDKMASRILNEWTSERQREFVEMYGGFYRAIGHFTVKKKNIKLFTDTRSELEIIAHPKDVTLKDYRFLTALDLITTQICISFCTDVTNNKITFLPDLDDIYEAFYWQIKCAADNDPTLIKKCLKMGLPQSQRSAIIKTVLKGFHQSIHGRNWDGNPSDVVSKGITKDGWEAVFFHNHAVRVKKPKITLYQSRVFNFIEIKGAVKPKLEPKNLFSGMGSVNAPVSSWFNKPFSFGG